MIMTESTDFAGLSQRGHEYGESSADISPMQEKSGDNQPDEKNNRPSERQRRRHKAMASIIVDQVCLVSLSLASPLIFIKFQVGGVIGQVALKNSKFNRDGQSGGLHSARRLARKLFSALSDVNPARSHLVVEGLLQSSQRVLAVDHYLS